MPVGRITYMYLAPLTFEEFLDAYGYNQLINYLQQYSWEQVIPMALHEQLMSLFKEYIIIGGMPAAVYSWVNEHSLSQINQIHHDLLSSYRDDFAKYAVTLSLSHLEDFLIAIPKMLGNKIVFSHVNPNVTANLLKSALMLLNQARIAQRIYHTAANGVPLAAEINEKYFKVILLDVGLVSAMLHLRLDHIHQLSDINHINAGGLSEQVVGQLLSSIEPFYISPKLYYWTREQKNSNAEIDYLIQNGTTIVPIEVKSGSSGSLKSLHLFMQLKQLSKAMRINAALPSKVLVDTKTHSGQIKYQLYSLPFYLIEQIYRL